MATICNTLRTAITLSGHWKTKHVLPYHVYYTERNNGVLSEHGSSKFQCQFHPSLLRGESFHSQNTHVTFPWSNCPKLDRQQAINIPYSFTKSVSSFVFVRHGLDPWKILHDTYKTQSCNNIRLNESWQRNNSFDVCYRKWLHCTVVVFPSSSILSFIVWWAHPVLISTLKMS